MGYSYNERVTESMQDKNMPKISEKLEDDLAKVINRHIRENGLTPQVAASTMNGMTIDFLDHLTWKPQDVQCAEIYLKEAQSWLISGTGKPILSHSSKNGDRPTLDKLISGTNPDNS